MSYELLKAAHVAAVVLSFTIFVLRGVVLLVDPERLHKGLDRVLPHTVDTLLLAFGLLLAWHTSQWPFQAAWLTAKIVGLIVYVLVGLYAFRVARGRPARAAGWLGAQAVFVYIVLVALTRKPMPFA